jgi:hypothetical protein
MISTHLFPDLILQADTKHGAQDDPHNVRVAGRNEIE